MKNRKALTLVEVVIAVTVITVALVAVYGLIISVLNVNQRNIHNLEAGRLAQEGLEVMRYFRDSNWLQNYAWDGVGDKVSYGHKSEIGFAFGISSGDSRTIYLEEDGPSWKIGSEPEEILNASGFVFNREILISKVPESTIGEYLDDVYQISSKVSWSERGIAKSVELSTLLSNWHE